LEGIKQWLTADMGLKRKWNAIPAVLTNSTSGEEIDPSSNT
jgi:hypothetical protein